MSDEPRDTGGPAFPFTPNEQMKLPDGTWDQNTEFGDPGMSLRDWFAGMAVANIEFAKHSENVVEHAQWAYGLADAMLAQRDKAKP